MKYGRFNERDYVQKPPKVSEFVGKGYFFRKAELGGVPVLPSF